MVGKHFSFELIRDLFADESASAFSGVPVIVASPDYGASVRTLVIHIRLLLMLLQV